MRWTGLRQHVARSASARSLFNHGAIKKDFTNVKIYDKIKIKKEIKKMIVIQYIIGILLIIVLTLLMPLIIKKTQSIKTIETIKNEKSGPYEYNKDRKECKHIECKNHTGYNNQCKFRKDAKLPDNCIEKNNIKNS